jgi:cytidylate kinase
MSVSIGGCASPFHVAIDGPSGTGRGALASGLAAELGLAHINMGPFYTSVARAVIARRADPADTAVCTAIAEALPARAAWRTDNRCRLVAETAAKVSAIPGVRAAHLDLQRRLAAAHPGAPNGAVMDGRDIGTVVLPGADLKFYLTATIAARTQRLHDRDPFGISLRQMRKSLLGQDAREETYGQEAVRPAGNAVIIDTTGLPDAAVLHLALREFYALFPVFMAPAMAAAV